MKKTFEQKIRESLSDFELPYDETAWQKLNNQLDSQTKTESISTAKWIIASGVAVMLVSFLVYTVTLEKPKTQVSKNTSVVKQTTPNLPPDSSKKSASSSANLNDDLNDVKTGSREINFSLPTTYIPYSKLELFSTFSDSSLTTKQSTTSQQTSIGDKQGTSPSPMNLIQLNNAVCVGEKVIVNNPLNLKLLVTDPNGARFAAKGTFTAESEGIYQIEYVEQDQLVTKHIQSLAIPKVDFNIEEQNTYDKGLPIVNLSTEASGFISWELEKQEKLPSAEAISVHYFKKGTYSLNLMVQHSNGCKSKATKFVHIDEDYNLLAVTGFDPLSSDSRKNVFIPYALTQRNTSFNMIIIDSQSGELVFETNEATNPWNGVNRRTGQLVEAKKSFIWKVTLANPEKGEPTEYKGVITRI